MTIARHTQEHVNAWREDGFAIVSDFFSADELAPLINDYTRLYGTSADTSGAVPTNVASDVLGAFRDKQFEHIDSLPYDGSTEMNLLSMHPSLIAFAEALLGVDQVHLYQSHTWAKFTGETDYAQDFHCDFGNHTLIVPADQPALRSVDFIVYLTDVTDAHGALHYVPKKAAAKVLGEGRIGAFKEDQQLALKAIERSAAGPSGTLVAHGIDTFHRGTNLTQENGYRFTMTIGYKAAGNDMVGYHVWQQRADSDWSIVMHNANPAQLACLGIPLPGDTYWTERTLRLTNARWPGFDMTAYFRAANLNYAFNG